MKVATDLPGASVGFDVPRLTIRDVSQLLGVSDITVWRYTKVGCLDHDGERVFLKAYRVGGFKRFHAADVRDFIDRLSEGRQPTSGPSRRELKAQAAARAKETERICRRAGV